MIEMPAALAFASESLIALAFGTETARPSTFWETAASMSCASFCGSLFDGLQMSFTPSSFAACWAPFLTTDQNDPSSLWVTIANFRLLPWVRSTFAGLLLVDDPVLLLALELVLSLAPPHPTTNAVRASTTSSPRLPSSLFMVLEPLLRRDPEWSGTRCSFQHRVPARDHPAAPAR